MLPASTSLADLEWVPNKRLPGLTRLNLATLGDLLRHYPHRHEDRCRFDHFPENEMDRAVCLHGVVVKSISKRLGSWKRIVEVVIEKEASGVLSPPVTCRWFNMPFIHKMIVQGDTIVVYGRPKKRGQQVVIDHPEFEIIDEDESSIHMNRIVPVHPAGEGISTRLLRSLVHQALTETDLSTLPSLLPAGQPESLRALHFPDSPEALESARQALVHEEFFGLQLLIQARRKEWERLPGIARQAKGTLLKMLVDELPFTLTKSQREVIRTIRRDLATPARMNRLLQGDVGSGKTLVALAAMLLTVESGSSAVLMAPTQILAEQHFLNFQRLLKPLGIPVSLRTAARKESGGPHAARVLASAARRSSGSGEPPDPAPEPGALPGDSLNIRYSKRNLPHFERPWAKYMVTFSTRNGLQLAPQDRQTILDSILHNQDRYELFAACVMPDHVHLLIEPAVKKYHSDEKAEFFSLTEILHTIKSFTAHQINQAHERKGPVWEKESFDRIIRSEADLQEKFTYILNNPREAGIIEQDEEYAFNWPTSHENRVPHAARVSASAARRSPGSGEPPDPAPGPGALPETPGTPGISGTPGITVGTHALFYDEAELDPPGLIVIDEQHKFGVLQRTRLIDRGNAPDVLIMTATPIPRTLTQTLYGDLEVSLLLEKPANRGEIQTVARESKKLPEVVAFLRKQIEKGRQAYIVYPLVEDSEKLAAKSATAEFEKWKPLLAPHAIGLIHGRLGADEKEAIMKDFRDGQLAALVATTVIEVGVDVPNANFMIVENAERFGLAQLHQLRGRIGRGSHKSYCILLHDPKAEDSAREKLTILEKTTDGFQIAEADLHLRGPGDLLGTAQTGLPPLKLGDLFADAEVMREAITEVAEIFHADPDLTRPEHSTLRNFIQESQAQVVAAAG